MEAIAQNKVLLLETSLFVQRFPETLLTVTLCVQAHKGIEFGGISWGLTNLFEPENFSF